MAKAKKKAAAAETTAFSDTSPDQLKKLIERAGMSQLAAARVIGVHPRTMRHYCGGSLPIPRKIEFALRWVAEGEPAVKEARSAKRATA